MNRKKRRKKKSRLILYCILLIACVALYFVLFRTYTEKTATKTVEEIKKYGYKLEKRDSDLMKENFNLLKLELEKDEVDEEKYAEYISKLFIIDLFSMNNKKSRYDVGGIEYVYKDYQESYKLKVQDTLYRFLVSDETKKSDLPEVSSITVDSIEESTFTYGDIDLEGYEVKISWEYVKDLGYDTESTIMIVQDGDKLAIASLSQEVNEDE